MFDLIDAATKEFSIYERQCGIVSDEVAITPGERFDQSTRQWVGKSTLPTHIGLAKKALVFMVAGLTRRYKDAVAYFFTNKRDPACTGNETGDALAAILRTVITKTERAGLEVDSVTSDMGPDNMALWKSLGIGGSRFGPVVSSFPNPVRPDREVFVLPDSPHLFKSIKRAIEVNKTILLPQALVESENLPTNLVQYRHIEELCEFESGFELKVAYRLNEDNLHSSSGHFQKMNVSTSRAALSHRTGVGLQKLAAEKKDPSFLTTAWFVLLLNTFFQLVTSRHQGLALSKLDDTVYRKAIEIIEKVDFLFQHMQFGSDGQWKPCQEGMQVLCASIIGLQKYCLDTLKFTFLLLGHLTQDCLENLFSCIRLGQGRPKKSHTVNLSAQCAATACESAPPTTCPYSPPVPTSPTAAAPARSAAAA